MFETSYKYKNTKILNLINKSRTPAGAIPESVRLFHL